MNEIDNLLLEHLKRIQAEQAAARERDQEVLARLSHIESALARLAREPRGQNITRSVDVAVVD